MFNGLYSSTAGRGCVELPAPNDPDRVSERAGQSPSDRLGWADPDRFPAVRGEAWLVPQDLAGTSKARSRTAWLVPQDLAGTSKARSRTAWYMPSWSGMAAPRCP